MLGKKLCLLSIRFLIFFNVSIVPAISLAMDCTTNTDSEGEIEGQVICDDGVVYQLVTLEETKKISIQLEDYRLVKQQLRQQEILTETIQNKVNSLEFIISAYERKSSLDEETVDRLMDSAFEITPWYRTNEFSFIVGAVTTVGAFVLWRYTEKYTE